MVRKGDLVKYLIIALICVGLVGLLLVLTIRMTGYAIFEISNAIEIEDVRCEGSILNINYSFDNTNIIGDSVSVEIWIVGEDGIEKKRVQDRFPINVDGLIKRNVEIELEDGLAEVYDVYLALSFDLDNFVKRPVVYTGTVNSSVTILEPAGAKTSRTVRASWIISDESPMTCSYNVYRGESLEIGNTSISCSTNSTSFEVSVDADFAFNFYVNDSAGNSNSTNSSFSVDTSSSQSPPSSGGGGGGGGNRRTTVVISNETKKANLQVSKIGNIIAREGDKKTLSLNVKNIGRIFLNNCRLIVKGEISSWVYPTKVVGIAPGENVDFAFDLNVPEGIESKDYSGQLEMKCDEGSNIQTIVVSMPKSFGLIEIKDIEQGNDILSINYDLDNSGLIGDSASVDIWIVDEDGIEIKRIQDVFAINKDGLIERNVEIDLPKNLAGIYYVYFALSSDLDDFIKQSVVLGKSGTTGTGFVIFDTNRGKVIIYIVFLLIMGVAVFFIWRRHGKTKHSKSKWFFGKKNKK